MRQQQNAPSGAFFDYEMMVVHCRHRFASAGLLLSVQHWIFLAVASHDPYEYSMVPVSSDPLVVPLRTHVVPDNVQPIGHEYTVSVCSFGQQYWVIVEQYFV